MILRNIFPRWLALALLFGSALATAQTAASPEARTERAFTAAKKAGAPELYAFLKLFPKGADLHMHLSGAVYAETFIAEAVKAGLCIAAVDPGTPATPVPEGAVRFVPSITGKDAPCGPGRVPASDALKNQKLYDALVDSFSMRGFVPSPGITGHDQFFSTFDRFGGLKNVQGEWLDEVASRAAAQNEQYLEIMNTPSFSNTAAAGYKIGFVIGLNDENHMRELAKLRDALLANGLRDDIAIDVEEFATAQRKRRIIEGCETDADAAAKNLSERHGIPETGYEPRCGVSIHFLYQVLRGFPPQQVFAQTLLGFEVASADPDVVGINFVMPEDGRISMQDYHRQMLMLDYLHSVYPKVHISLHAGELAPGMVAPDGLRFHIREAIDLGHAERIGHGVDVLYENDPQALLKEMAAKHIMVEVNLTSNDAILGIKGTDHPLAAYRAAHVPFALSTDDEGVSRIDLTHEYVRAALEQNLTYADLKQSARTSLEHSFLPGASLWTSPDNFTHRVSACATPINTSTKISASCTAFLGSSERAAQQWELERRFAAFEATPH
ncbi:MAG: adenosine deaminase [Acidobacteriota bacterium]|nr:adenosine deaminase [Acidobacteriota bacterium]